MSEPDYRHDRIDEKTVAIVAGQGEGADREVVIRTSAAYSAASDIETFCDGRNAASTAALQAEGDATLTEAQAAAQFSFSVVQTPSCFYGVHYDLGDLVTARYRDIVAVQKIVGVTVEVGRDGERIDVEMEAV